MTKKQLKLLLTTHFEAGETHGLSGAAEDGAAVKENMREIHDYTVERLWLEIRFGARNQRV